MNYYQFTYDTTQGFDSSAIHKFVSTSTEFPDWWHYLPNVYLIESNLMASEITDKILRAFPSLRFLVVKIDLTSYNGFLKKSAWEWFKRQKNQNIKLKIAPSTNFTKTAVQKAIEDYNVKTPTPNIDAILEILKKRNGSY